MLGPLPVITQAGYLLHCFVCGLNKTTTSDCKTTLWHLKWSLRGVFVYCLIRNLTSRYSRTLHSLTTGVLVLYSCTCREQKCNNFSVTWTVESIQSNGCRWVPHHRRLIAWRAVVWCNQDTGRLDWIEILGEVSLLQLDGVAPRKQNHSRPTFAIHSFTSPNFWAKHAILKPFFIKDVLKNCAIL